MNPFKSRKKSKRDEDPILKKVKKQQPEIEEEVPQQPNIKSEKIEKLEKLIEEEDNQTQLFDKFLKSYNEDENQKKKKKKKRIIEDDSAFRVKTKQFESDDAKLFTDFGPEEKKDTDYFLAHYGQKKDLQSWIAKYLDEADKKKKAKADAKPVNSIISSAVDFNFDSKESKNQYKDEQEALNNGVQIKDYKLKSNLKDANILYKDKDNNLLMMNKCYEESYTADSMPQKEAVVAELASAKRHYADEINENEEKLYSRMKSYRDFVYCDPNEDSCVSFRKVYISHIVAHFAKIQQLRRKNKEIDDAVHETNDESKEAEKIQLDGYTKPRVLILTPNKGDCYEIVRAMKLILSHKSLKKKGSRSSRFIEEFGDIEKELDDEFKLGMNFENESLKLFSSFETADVIIASPLGLRLVIGAQGDQDRKFAFLSSIEICVLDRCHVFYMQNWQHIEEIFDVINKIPRHKDVVNSITEINGYYFENLARFFRQTIVYTEFRFPELNSLVRSHLENYNGILMNKPVYRRLNTNGEYPVNEEFIRFEVNSHTEEPQTRFDLFFKKIWDKIRGNDGIDKMVIFTSSYFEFVRLRNQFKKMNSSVAFISEYSNKQKIQSRVAKFNKGLVRFLLVTERAHFFQVFKAKKFQHIFFYSLPHNSLIYKELLAKSEPIQAWKEGDHSKEVKIQLSKMVIKSIFCRFDAMVLERIVGTDKTREFLEDYNKGSTFVL